MFNLTRCPICSAPLVRRFDADVGDRTMAVSICRDCRSYVKTPFYDPNELMEIYAHYAIHERHYSVPQGEIDNMAERLVRIRQYCGIGKLLEVGCGRGHFLSMARSAGWDACGLELEGSSRDNLLPNIREHVRFVESESAFSSIPSSTYDVICSYQVLEHLMNPRETISHMARGLREGGILIVNTPNGSSPGARAHQERWLHQRIREHFILFSEAALRRLYQEQGIEVLKACYGGPPFLTSGSYTVSPQTCSSPNDKPSAPRKESWAKQLPWRVYRSRFVTRLARLMIYRFGLGDHIELIGRK